MNATPERKPAGRGSYYGQISAGGQWFWNGTGQPGDDWLYNPSVEPQTVGAQPLRYYQKSYPYSVLPGAVNSNGAVYGIALGAISPWQPVRFHRPMAKTPTLTAYSPPTGAKNMASVSGADSAVNGFSGNGETGFGGVTLTTLPTANFYLDFHYTADTGW
jgi:hypothetical protein